jgi:serine/threonine protein kinase
MSAEEIFHQALARPPVERPAFLAAVCAGNEPLQRRVQALLHAHDNPGSFLAQQPPAPAMTIDHPISERPGTVIGPYKLMEQIGEGGMGLVFVAEQQHPVRRKVALKVIKPGMDTRQVVARFEAERQALALMDHPNIARVFDGGTTDSGRPYFVMELVKGVPITEYCDQNQVPIRQRLELLVSVCQAVQHAHQKGIIHRDIKPSNVLITLYDGSAVVKVIDFGVAKAIGQQLTDKTIYTQFSQMVGTPLYMSPEQAWQSGLDVDTRSDIYSLGVLLYELLTGTTPFDKERLREVSYDEMRRIIREEEPPKPSTRISTLGQAATTLSTQRQSDPKRLSQLFRGELDWIVMKCLEKDRGRRYETANGLAQDLKRYLANEPVVAGPPSARYRLHKFFRRNRILVAVAGTIFFLLLGGVVGTSIGFVRAEWARKAEQERAEGERLAKLSAEKRLAQVEKGIDLLGAIFENLDPQAEEKEGRPLRMILGDRLDQTAVDLEGEAVGDPLVVARLQDRLARTYLALGQPAKAATLFTKALATRRAELGADDRLTLRTLSGLAQASYQGGKPLEALQLHEQVRDAQLRTLGADDPETLANLNYLGEVYWLTGDATRAIDLLEQVRERRAKQLGEDHDDTLATLDYLSRAYSSARRNPEAIAASEKVLTARVKKYGNDHPLTLAAMNSLALQYQAGYKMKQALALFEQARVAVVPKLGPNHPNTLKILVNLAHIYMAFGRTSEAIALGEEVLEKRKLLLGSEALSTLDTMYVLALAYQADKQLDKALPLFEQAALGIEKLKFAHRSARLMIDRLCECLEQLKHYEKAEVWRRKWLAAKAKEGPESGPYVQALWGLGSNLFLQEKYSAAETILRERLALLGKQPSQDARIFDTQALLGAALLGQQKYQEAEPLLVGGYQGLKASQMNSKQPHAIPPSTSQRLSEVLERLVQLYDAWGKKGEADKWRKELEGKKLSGTK